jgi:hypothetical protein
MAYFPIRRTFQFPAQRVFETSIRAVISLGYDLDNFNKEIRMVTFHTGISWRTRAGEDMTILIHENGPTESEVLVGGSQRLPLSIWDSGEANAIAGKFLGKLEELLTSPSNENERPF